MEIKTKRLLLRPVLETDAEDMYEYSKNPNVGPNAGWAPHKSIEETAEVIKAIFLNKDGIFSIVVPETGKVIGSVGLIQDPMRENEKALMIGYALGEEYWGKGIMTEAAQAVIKYGFEELGLELVSARYYPHNNASKRILEKCGMVYEGTLRRGEKLFDGQILDLVCCSVTKEEFFNRIKKY